ncbi:phosphoglycerate mutase family protein [Pedobacter metabolipauper]|uniref:Histidine phosphatase superfamily protein (Branch 1) n=1 Tax=Pedobacter metabolipauper TaxID=425513 RepID=A0A4R6SWF8_9SPHI|nr:phosphoglycerate mutase family protein [Pedobacter metabolipauper]TDQ10288.1 histidine phosphatase superfamily protein (branch 1) [Pedobacter metabolipauper]
MKKLFGILLILVVQSGLIYAQEKPLTIILLRHAEKENDGTKDPALSEKGKQFAQKISSVLAEVRIDAAYSTSYKRTNQTIAQLAAKNQVAVKTYDPSKSNELIREIERSGNKTIVISGHSNTVNLIYNLLIKDNPIKELGDDEYRKVFIITYDPAAPSKSTALKLDLNP